ncbi:nucleoside triphosphate pyrophosphohydrolase [Candidatus Micrarchaeota archaeon]|nr:nucleoside triphosphate pyrophosphohydrolase [Candidatus Micrarchaeota archaeon]
MKPKLVRDNIPTLIKQDGRTPVTRLAKSEEEFESLLKEKLLEEVKEFLENPVADEFADVMHALDALREFYDFDEQELLEVKSRKLREKGGFSKRTVLEKIIE